jgi:hypothetical protein
MKLACVPLTKCVPRSSIGSATLLLVRQPGRSYLKSIDLAFPDVVADVIDPFLLVITGWRSRSEGSSESNVFHWQAFACARRDTQTGYVFWSCGVIQR